jgi:hypothetical protein
MSYIDIVSACYYGVLILTYDILEIVDCKPILEGNSKSDTSNMQRGTVARAGGCTGQSSAQPEAGI